MSFGDDTLDPANIPPERYFLDQDGDGHWYTVPVRKRREWVAWLNQLPSDDADTNTPAYAMSIGCAPNYITFTNPKKDL